MGIATSARHIFVLSLLASTAAHVPALAQETETADEQERGAAIVVTANKRVERITDVPYAVTAIGQREIQDRGAVDIKDLQYSIPGLNIQELSPGANRTTLRGINPGAGTGLPIVGIYVDDVGISVDQQQRDGAFPLVDLERIEVLRGPQGTLYGQGSMAGTIRYITRDPDLDSVDGYVEGNIYNQRFGDIGYRANGAIGIPIAKDVAGLRIAGGYDYLAGWIDYPNAPGGGVKDANNTKRFYVRPKLVIRPDDALKISLLYQYYEQTTDADGISGFDGVRTRALASLTPGKDRLHLINAIVDYDFGPATLTSSTGYQDRQLLLRGAFGPFIASFDTAFKQFSQEVRLSSNGDGPFRYTIGGWYRDFTSNGERTLFLNGTATPTLRRSGDDPVDSESWAIFGEGSYAFTDQLELTLGARYYDDRRSSGAVIPVTVTRRAKFDAFSPKATLRYKWSDDSSTYLTVSQGFRSGGFNGTGSIYGPEKLWNYELGTKTSLFNDALFIDAAVYYVDYKDRQAQSIVPGGAAGVFLTETRNAGAASGFGIEVAISANLGSGFELSATGAYNDITADVTNAEVIKGERFGFVPAFTGSVSLSQRFGISESLEGMWRIDYQHSDAYDSIFRGLGTPAAPGAQPPVVILEDFSTQSQDYLNLRAGIEKDRWGLYFDVTNLLNEDSYLFPNSPVAVSREGTHARPRSYGLTLRWNFGE
ncbi:TonB-dependent receptor [Blastomonas fulva]|uniref:TonB-dependent receptor n=1 Tax=Blastomonas fulva TaxID=1550728 RepID=UPI003D28544B